MYLTISCQNQQIGTLREREREIPSNAVQRSAEACLFFLMDILRMRKKLHPHENATVGENNVMFMPHRHVRQFTGSDTAPCIIKKRGKKKTKLDWLKL